MSACWDERYINWSDFGVKKNAWYIQYMGKVLLAAVFGPHLCWWKSHLFCCILPCHKFGYRIFLKYMDGTVRPQQKAGFSTEKEANAARDNLPKTDCQILDGMIYEAPSVRFF